MDLLTTAPSPPYRTFFTQRAVLVAVRLCLLLVLPSTPSAAQLVAPGKLSAVHASLEGVSSCTKCHSAGDNTAFRSNCLACHVEIRTRVEKGRGYHAITKKLECSTCHKEHHGRDFKLIRWDPAKFDHRQAGFELSGSHAGVECRRCHNEKQITQQDIRKKSPAARQRTFLGLDPACATCHRDEHAGTLGNSCTSCHTTTAWRQHSFVHSKARFSLAGRHAFVPCSSCHPRGKGSKEDPDGALTFTRIPHSSCLDCHQDTKHHGAFGSDCASCHSPAGWKLVTLSQKSFDHRTTDFPLLGRHATVPCTRCHTGGGATFSGRDLTKCTACHQDPHAGQFGTIDCAACHGVDGFVPTTYSTARHEASSFPLRGAHAAIPCARCHVESTVNGRQAIRFRWPSHACTECHADPHAGQFAERIAADGCASCHSVDSWIALGFDHDATDFPLLGRHAGVACSRCHQVEEVNGIRTNRFADVSIACASCHRDPHRGQFADAGGPVDCATCHRPDGWNVLTFNHRRQSRFELTGRHAELSCDACHRQESIAGDSVLVRRYKPMDTRCTACHREARE